MPELVHRVLKIASEYEEDLLNDEAGHLSEAGTQEILDLPRDYGGEPDARRVDEYLSDAYDSGQYPEE